MSEGQLPKRFYDSVSYDEGPEGFSILLDGRNVRTPARAELCVSGKVLAEEIAREWDAQKETIDPATMPMTKRANTALDRVRGREEEVVGELVEYAGADLLCYRAESPEELIQLQCTHWDPVLAWVKTNIGAEFKLQTGISHIAQPEQSLALIGSGYSAYDPFELAPLYTLTTLTGSALLVLAFAKGHLDVDELWAAAHVDEDWQISQWGEDAEAEARRAIRRAELGMDASFLALVRS
jgi:chaperone required for assembly of F1-ATPase